MFHRAHGALILEVYAGTFVLDVASVPGFALATRARASPLGEALHWPHGPKQIQGRAGLHFQCSARVTSSTKLYRHISTHLLIRSPSASTKLWKRSGSDLQRPSTSWLVLMCSQMPFIRVLYGATISVHGVLLSRIPVWYRSGTGPVSLFPTGATLLLSPVLVRYRSGTGPVPVWYHRFPLGPRFC